MAKSKTFSNVVVGALVIMTVLIIGSALNYHYFWPAKARAEHALGAYAMNDIKLNRTYFGIGCSKEDKIHFKFTAKNASGKPVDGVICMGIFKAATVRVN